MLVKPKMGWILDFQGMRHKIPYVTHIVLDIGDGCGGCARFLFLYYQFLFLLLLHFMFRESFLCMFFILGFIHYATFILVRSIYIPSLCFGATRSNKLPECFRPVVFLVEPGFQGRYFDDDTPGAIL